MSDGASLVGRRHELERLFQAVDRASAVSACLVLEGEPGIGKTALLDATIERAGALGHRVAVSRPTVAETPLAFAGLGDVLRGLDLSLLPAPQQRALEIALGLLDGTGEPPQAHELGTALLTLVERLVADGPPLVVVIDDLQWLDVATREVLAFALRRLPTAGLCVIAARRPETDPLAWGTLVELRGLDPASTVELVRRSTAALLPSHLVARVVDGSGGNPLFTIELARSLQHDRPAPGRPAALPPSLATLVADRFRALSSSTIEALAAAAMLSRPSTDELDALGLLQHLAPAEAADIVDVRGRQIVFRHPLLSTAAHDAVPATLRLDLHRRLAAVTSGSERCIHLALGSVRRDTAIGAELAEAARSEARRGARVEAAELALLAIEMTPAGDAARSERHLLASDMLFRAGRTDDAIAAAQTVVDDPAAPIDRHRALLAMSTIEFSRSDDAETAATLARRVVAEATDPDLLADAHTILARAEYTDFELAASHADAALQIIRARVPVDRVALAQALNAAASARFLAGHGLDRAAFDQAIELEVGTDVLDADSAYGALAAMLKYADDIDEAREMFEDLARRSDAGSLPYALSHLPQLYLWTGRWDEAEQCAHRHLRLAEQTSQESQIFTARFNVALVAAFRGDVDDAEQIGHQIFADGRDHGVPWTERNGGALLGFTSMTRGDAASAVRYFDRYADLGEQMNIRDPGYQRYHADYLEALVAIGDIGRAEQVIDLLDGRSKRLNRLSGLATARRGRALVAAHRGDREAMTHSAAAIELLSGTPFQYELARSLLIHGVVCRRLKERGTARTALTDALARFEEMGTPVFAERTRRELERVGGRTVAPRSTELTATEAGVARLAAAGRTTRQMADELFISVKTVEANLTRVYRKLGLANRAQLANHMSALPPE